MRHALLTLCAWLFVQPAPAGELRLDARAVAERSVTQNLRLRPDGSAIELETGELFEDDGPAAGYSYQPNEERLSDKVWVRKELVVPNPQARSATLLVGPGGVGLKVLVNGRPVELRSAGKIGRHWESYTIPTETLKAGTNEIVLHGSGRVWIARAEDFAAGSVTRPNHPGRSARSGDGGANWNADRLGASGEFRGEYCVRLFLDHYRPAGSLTLPVLDLGNLAGRVVAPALTAIGPVRIGVEAETGPNGRVGVRVRTGTTPVPNAKTWSEWQALDADGQLRQPTGRFVQVAVELSTPDPLRTPSLKTVRIEARPEVEKDWATRLKVVEAHNEVIARSAVPFAYEPFDHPRLQELRKRYKLDEVVAGAKTEFELIERLARWSARQWERGHLSEAYPAWDALEILKPHADGKPVGGFCQQYNVVFLQACESLGIPGRAVSIGHGDHGGKVPGSGHEVVELWSNQYKKWVYVDGNMAWYAVDSASGVPLSLWELRRRQVRAVAGKPFEPIRVVEMGGPRRWTGLTDWPPFLELRLVPRSNFLEQKAPLPLNQGMRGWFWTGHYAWTDTDYPASMMYRNRITGPREWNWTLNQARYTLEATSTPGEVRVHLETETPGFDTFLAAIDGGPAKPVPASFVWKLHAGRNRLEVRPRNTAGREGIASRVTLEEP